MARSKRGLTGAAIYLGIVVISALPIAFGAGKLAGIYVLAVTLPWSLLSPLLGIGGDIGMAFVVMGALINAAIIYTSAALLDARRNR